MTSISSQHSSISTGTAVKTGAAAGVVAAILNVVVSAIARGPFDASDDFAPLTPGPIVLWSVLGAVLGALGWRVIVNRRADSGKLLTWLVPTVLVLSLVPDLALLANGESMTGQSTSAVVALMVMHVLTAVVVVAAYRKTMPPR